MNLEESFFNLLIREVARMSWCAGYFEGEGTITITRSRKHTRARVLLSSTDKESIDIFKNKWRGRVRSHQPKGNAKLSWDWALEGNEKIAHFIADIYPFLRRQKVKSKFEIVLSDIGARVQGIRDGNYLKECHERRELIRELNKRGKR